MNPNASASVLVPLEIAAAMIAAGTSVAEPDASRGEVAWVAGGSYTVGQERTYEHDVYKCAVAHSGSSTTPDVDDINWSRDRPTNRFAPFDYYIGTRALGTGAVTFVLQPGFFTDVDVRGLLGDRVQITVRDAPGGAVLGHLDADLWDQAAGLYELLFRPLGKTDQAELAGIDISPTAELTVTVTGGAGAEVGIGKLSVGMWQNLLGTSDFGATEQGATARPRSYSYVKYFDDGTYEYKRRRRATDLAFVYVARDEEGATIKALLDAILDVPVVVKASNLARFSYLSTVGVVDGTVAADGAIARVSINVRGFI